MATTTYFAEEITDQGGTHRLAVEFGRSSFYDGSPVPGGTGTDSLYLNVEGRMVVMDRHTARRFVEAVVEVGRNHGLLD